MEPETDYLHKENFAYKAIAQPKLGRLIKENRKAKKLSQRQLGVHVGVSFQTIAYWENGSRAPIPANLIRLARALGQPDDFFFCRVPEQKTELVPSSLYENLRNYRSAYGISQVKLSEQTCIALNRIQAYEDENSGQFITNEDLYKLCDFFKVEPQELLGHSSTVEEMEATMRNNYLREIREATEILNLVGLQKAAERITELTELSRYCE